MKLTMVLLFIAISQLMATGTYSQSTRISLHLKDAAVKEVLDKIEDNSEFFFLYNSKLVNVDRTVSANFKNQMIEDILNKL
ncbi:MAG: STN domain-containing protein, partial [Bacteroidota bacterium]|nr:STN domain-containing protein [Bacteroidota bacterium]